MSYDRTDRHVALSTGGLVLVAVLVALSVALYFTYPFYRIEFANWWYSRPFDSATWKATKGDTSDYAPRLYMVDYLMERQLLLGKTKSEVLELLGEPDRANAGVRQDVVSYDRDLIYWLGPERSFLRIDSEMLVIDIGDDGLVTGVYLETD